MSKKTRKKSPPALKTRARPSSKLPPKKKAAKARKTTPRASTATVSKSATKPTHAAASKKRKTAPIPAKNPASVKPRHQAAPSARAPAPAAPPKPTLDKKSARASAVGETLVEGMRAPAFTLPAADGAPVSLQGYSGKKLVIFFYPRADTPGCTKEAIDFSRLTRDFTDADTAMLGISADQMKTQQAFRRKHDLQMPLASDEAHGMLNEYGVWGEKSMYGRTFHGIIRTTVLVGADGRIAKVWRHVKVDGHAEEVLAAAQKL